MNCMKSYHLTVRHGRQRHWGMLATALVLVAGLGSSQPRVILGQQAFRTTIERQVMEYPVPDRPGDGEQDKAGYQKTHSPLLSEQDEGIPLEMPEAFGPTGGYFARLEFLLGWRKPSDLPPLVTTSTPGTPLSDAGVLGLPGTSILFGDERVGGDVRPGGRLEVGRWCGPCQTWNVTGRFFVLADSRFAFSASSDQFEILARPFFNVSNNQEDALVVAFPGITDGEISVTGNSDVLGGDALFGRIIWLGPHGTWEIVGGYQFARIDEALHVRSILTNIDPGGTLPVGTQTTVDDLFSTRNEFHGGSIGLRWRRETGQVQWEALAKVGLGNLRREVLIDGRSVTITPGGGTSELDAGLLAQPSNAGTHVDNRFAVVPELGIRLWWDATPWLRLEAGYWAMFWNHVAQAAEQIDLAVNPTQVPGPPVGDPAPVFSLRDTDYWIHGLSLGGRIEF